MALLQSARLTLAALLLGACSSASPGRVVLGEVQIDNLLPRPVVFRAVWSDEPTGVHVLVEGMVPAAGASARFEQQAGIPAGVELRFAVEGAGCAELLERNGLRMERLTPPVAEAESWESSGFLLRQSGTEPREVGPLEPAQASWTATGGEARLVLREGADGALRLEQR